MTGRRIGTGKHDGILPDGLRLPHGCVVGMCFAFETTVGYVGLCEVSCAYGSPADRLQAITITERVWYRPGHIPPHRFGRYGALGSRQGRRYFDLTRYIHMARSPL
jgi:hypothetical protein